MRPQQIEKANLAPMLTQLGGNLNASLSFLLAQVAERAMDRPNWGANTFWTAYPAYLLVTARSY